MTFDELWTSLPIPGEYDAMDQCDKGRWRDVIERAFDAAVAAERERCAKLVETYPEWLGQNAAREIAYAIRKARS